MKKFMYAPERPADYPDRRQRAIPEARKQNTATQRNNCQLRTEKDERVVIGTQDAKRGGRESRGGGASR